jgi:hypothetical protein
MTEALSLSIYLIEYYKIQNIIFKKLILQILFYKKFYYH